MHQDRKTLDENNKPCRDIEHGSRARGVSQTRTVGGLQENFKTMYINQGTPSTHANMFAAPLRPSPSPPRSSPVERLRCADLVEKLRAYTQAKNFTKSSCHSKHVKSLIKDMIYESLSSPKIVSPSTRVTEIEKSSSKKNQPNLTSKVYGRARRERSGSTGADVRYLCDVTKCLTETLQQFIDRSTSTSCPGEFLRRQIGSYERCPGLYLQRQLRAEEACTSQTCTKSHECKCCNTPNDCTCGNEKICTCSCRSKLLEAEIWKWTQTLPIYPNMSYRKRTLRDNMLQEFVETAKAYNAVYPKDEFIEKIKEKAREMLDGIPMWLPDGDDQEKEFKQKLVDTLGERLKNKSSAIQADKENQYEPIPEQDVQGSGHSSSEIDSTEFQTTIYENIMDYTHDLAADKTPTGHEKRHAMAKDLAGRAKEILLEPEQDREEQEGMVRDELTQFFRKLSLDTDRPREEIIEDLTNKLQRLASSTPKKRKARGNEDRGLDTTAMTSIYDDNEDRSKLVQELKYSEAQYLKELEEVIGAWIDSLPVDMNVTVDGSKIKDNTKQAIARDIINRKKYKKFHPASENDPRYLDMLKYQIFKCLNNKLGPREVAAVMPEAEALIKDLDRVETPDFIKFKNLERRDLDEVVAGPSGIGPPKNEMFKIVDDWVKVLPLSSGTPQDKVRSEKMKKALANKLKTNALHTDPKILKDNFKFNNILEEEIDQLLEELPQTPEILGKKQALKTDLMEKVKESQKKALVNEIVDDWVKDLPLPSGSLQDKERSEQFKMELGNKLKTKVNALHADPNILKDDLKYSNILEEDINQLFKELPQTSEIVEAKEALKTDLIQKFKQNQKNDQIYEIVDNWVNDLPLPSESPQDKAKSKKMKKALANQLKTKVNALHAESNILKDDLKYNNILKRVIDQCLEELPQTPEIIEKKEALKVDFLEKIKDCNKKGYSYEIIDDWLRDIPMPGGTPQDKIRNENIKKDLAKKLKTQLNELQIEPYILKDDFKYNYIIEEEIDNFFEDLPQTPEIVMTKEALKVGLIEKIKESQKRAKTYEIIDDWMKDIPMPGETPQDEKGSEKKKKELANKLKTNVNELYADPNILKDNSKYNNILEDQIDNFLKDLSQTPESIEKKEALKIGFIEKNKKSQNKAKAHEMVDDWVKDMSMPGETPQDKERIEKTKTALVNKLKSKVNELHADPNILKDDNRYHYILLEEVDQVLEELPQTPEIIQKKETLKEDFIQKVKENQKKVKINEILEDWVKNLPISGETPHDKERSDKLNKALANNLKNKVIALHDKSNILNDDYKYNNMLEEEVEDFLEELAQTPEIVDRKEALKADLMEKIKQTQKNAKLNEMVDNWVKNLPMPSETPEMKERSTQLKIVLADKLKTKVKSLHADPNILKNYFKYNDILEEEVDQVLEDLPQTREIIVKKEALKADFMEKIKDSYKKAKNEHEKQNFKQQVIYIVSQNLPQARNAEIKDKVALEIFKDDIADALVNMSYEPDEKRREELENKLENKLKIYAEEIKKLVPGTNADPEKIKNDLVLDLKQIRVPDSEFLKDEVEKVRIKDEIKDWIEELPLKTNLEPEEQLKIDRLVARTAEKLQAIEKEKQKHPEVNYDEEMEEEIEKLVRKLPFNTGDVDVREMTDKLMKLLKDSEDARHMKTEPRILPNFGESGRYQIPPNLQQPCGYSPCSHHPACYPRSCYPRSCSPPLCFTSCDPCTPSPCRLANRSRPKWATRAVRPKHTSQHMTCSSSPPSPCRYQPKKHDCLNQKPCDGANIKHPYRVIIFRDRSVGDDDDASRCAVDDRDMELCPKCSGKCPHPSHMYFKK